MLLKGSREDAKSNQEFISRRSAILSLIFGLHIVRLRRRRIFSASRFGKCMASSYQEELRHDDMLPFFSCKLTLHRVGKYDMCSSYYWFIVIDSLEISSIRDYILPVYFCRSEVQI